MNNIAQKTFVVCFMFMIPYAEAAIWENIPAFPQAVKVRQEETLINNNPVQITIYSTTEPAEKVIEFYKTRLTNFGWTLGSNPNRQFENLLVFSKEDKLANVLVQNIMEKNFITVTQSRSFREPQKKDSSCSECEKTHAQVPQGEGAPSSDTPGRDLQFVPRYPGSIRVNSTERENGKKVAINYYTKDSVEGALDFYRKNMGNYYWSLENEVDLQDLPEELSEKINIELQGKSLVFKSSSASCIISVFKEPKSGNTIIGVNYNEK